VIAVIRARCSYLKKLLLGGALAYIACPNYEEIANKSHVESVTLRWLKTMDMTGII